MYFFDDNTTSTACLGGGGFPPLRNEFRLAALLEGCGMVRVVHHLDIPEMERRCRTCPDPVEAHHV